MGFIFWTKTDLPFHGVSYSEGRKETRRHKNVYWIFGSEFRPHAVERQSLTNPISMTAEVDHGYENLVYIYSIESRRKHGSSSQLDEYA